MQIRAEIREKTNASKLRKEGKIPAVFYGKGENNILLLVDKKEFYNAIENGGLHSVYDLNIKDEVKKVLIREVQKDPSTQEIIHIDFYKPDFSKKVDNEIDIVVVGESPAVKNLGGTLVKVMPTITIKSLPQDCPNEVKIDVSKLENIDDKIFIKDINLGENIEILDNPDDIVVQVVPREDVEKELESSMEGDVQQVEKIEKEKDREQDKEEEKDKG